MQSNFAVFIHGCVYAKTVALKKIVIIIFYDDGRLT